MRRVDELISELQKVAQEYQRVTQRRIDEINALIESVEVEGKKFGFGWVCSNESRLSGIESGFN